MIEADVAWMNGKMVPFADARVHISTHALHYGIGVFEGIRCYKRGDGRSAVFRLREHIERLWDSAKICLLDVPYTREQMTAACLETIRANKLPEAYIRPLVYLGAGSLGVGSRESPVDVAIIAFRWASSLGEEGLQRGLRARVSSFTRDHANATMTKAKVCGQYVNSTLAKREAQAAGADEAILLDPSGRVAEASAENIFVLWRGRLMTPPLSAPILAGITRDSVLELARKEGLEVVEETFTRDMLYTADEIFLTGTAAEVTPVREIDGRTIGSGEPGPVTRKLQALYFEAARGATTPRPDWLAYV